MEAAVAVAAVLPVDGVLEVLQAVQGLLGLPEELQGGAFKNLLASSGRS